MQTGTQQAYRTLAELTPADWQQGEISTADGATIHYTRTGGQKPPLVLLHGLQASGLMWLRTARALAAEYDLVLPDFRGHGRSSRLLGELAAETLVADTITLLDTLNIKRPAVIGHSMGADIAGRLAAAQTLCAVVLVDPALRNFSAAMKFDAASPPPWMAAFLARLEALRSQSHAERMVTGRALLPPGMSLPAEEDYVSFVEAQAQFDLSIYQHAPKMGYLFEAPEVIARINSPVLLLTARPMMPAPDATVNVGPFERNLASFEHVHFADSGHFIMSDQFERFIATVQTFLQAHA